MVVTRERELVQCHIPQLQVPSKAHHAARRSKRRIEDVDVTKTTCLLSTVLYVGLKRPLKLAPKRVDSARLLALQQLLEPAQKSALPASFRRAASALEVQGAVNVRPHHHAGGEGGDGQHSHRVELALHPGALRV